jgi:hypothetical protein
MDPEEIKDFKEKIDIGKKVRLETRFQRHSGEEDTEEVMEGYVARLGWLTIYLTDEPVEKPLSLPVAGFKCWNSNAFYSTIKKYEVLE